MPNFYKQKKRAGNQYCISDIHGCSKTLLKLLEQLKISKNDTVFFLGDYIDRGPDSKGVLDIIMNMPNAICHMGNHEDMLLEALDNPLDSDKSIYWMQNGGEACLKSFNSNITSGYVEFIRKLLLITELDKFYLCHAGLANQIELTTKDIFLWDRDCEVQLTNTEGRKLICGHTPTNILKIQESLDSKNKIIIDNGCVFKHHFGLGSLTALRLNDLELFTQINID